jgi:flavin reductase (DIM6/NTAB) family NADH-FMN oxidoreductase RutF
MTKKIEVSYTDYLQHTLNALKNDGLLLTSTRKDESVNVMTIGWGTIGIVWSLPMFLVMVRPSRLTYDFLQQTEQFTVNVPAEGMSEAVLFCGKNSGRDVDKFAKTGLTAIAGRNVRTPMIDECILHYECQVIYTNDFEAERISEDVAARCYPQGNYNKVYYGKILSVFANEGLA